MGSKCEICFKRLDAEEEIIYCNSCGSDLHRVCVSIETSRNNICPVCKNAFFIIRTNDPILFDDILPTPDVDEMSTQELRELISRPSDPIYTLSIEQQLAELPKNYPAYTHEPGIDRCAFHPYNKAQKQCEKCYKKFCQVSWEIHPILLRISYPEFENLPEIEIYKNSYNLRNKRRWQCFECNYKEITPDFENRKLYKYFLTIGKSRS